MTLAFPTRRGADLVYGLRRGLLGSSLGCGLGGGARLGVAGKVFLDARLLAFQATQVIQLAGADRATALDLDRIDGGAVRLEDALDAIAVRDLAHGEGGVEAGVLLEIGRASCRERVCQYV